MSWGEGVGILPQIISFASKVSLLLIISRKSETLYSQHSRPGLRYALLHHFTLLFTNRSSKVNVKKKWQQ